MRNLQMIVLALSLVMASASCRSIVDGSVGDGMFYLDGVNRDDGMSASIDMDSETIRVASDRFALRSCGESRPSRGCINSPYFLLNLEGIETDWWSYDGIDYRLSKRCMFSSPSGEQYARAIESEQNHGVFDFYLNSSGELLGWALTHAEGTDTYLWQGLKLASCDPARSN